MKKRWTAALLALMLAVALLPGTAQAAQVDQTAQADRSAGARFTGVDRAVYQVLRTEIEKIAAGRRTSTAIRIPDQGALSWSESELNAANAPGTALEQLLEDQLRQVLHVDQVFYALSADLPFDMFWQSNEFSCGYSAVRQGGRISIKNLVIQIQVAEAYRAGSSTAVSADKVSAANRAAGNAKAVVEQYRDKSDYEKLIAYREEICRLTSYNLDAFWDDDLPYGDPWQLVYVFDGDPDTNVVCEGYAKAFKYLCDLSDFSGDVTCYIASGYMNGGLHMWNVVRMGDGQNYLVDVTNCDSGMIGADDKLFLAGATSSSDGRTWTVSKNSCRGVYAYWSGQEGLFTDGYLALSADDYVDRPDATITITPPDFAPDSKPAFTDVPAEAYYAGAVAWAVEQGITNGTTTTTFSPGQDCTQAQILTFLWRAAGKPEVDGQLSIPVAEAYRGAILWADSMGMIDFAAFDPDKACTRATAVTYIWQAFEKPPATPSSFIDVEEDAPCAQAVDWAVEKEVTLGATDTTFNPDGICSRGQIVTFLYRAYSQST